MKNAQDAMVGLFFHSYDENGQIKRQGCIDARMGDGLYLVTTFSWFSGCDYDKRLVPLDDMKGWTLYSTAEAMREVSDKVNAEHRRKVDEGTGWEVGS